LTNTKINSGKATEVDVIDFDVKNDLFYDVGSNNKTEELKVNNKEMIIKSNNDDDHDNTNTNNILGDIIISSDSDSNESFEMRKKNKKNNKDKKDKDNKDKDNKDNVKIEKIEKIEKNNKIDLKIKLSDKIEDNDKDRDETLRSCTSSEFKGDLVNDEDLISNANDLEDYTNFKQIFQKNNV